MTPEAFLETFDQLAEVPGAVARLREVILELAVWGRLLPGEPSASPDQPSPHSLPDHWRWSILSDVVDCRASAKVPPSAIADAAWVLDLEDIDGTTGQIIRFATFAERRSLSTKAAFEPGDVLYGRLRPYLNKVVVATTPGYCTTEIIPLRPASFLSPHFLRLFLRSRSFLRYAAQKNYGMKMPRMGTRDLESVEIPLPPLAEQKRIVARVDELMALCDRLEALQQEREQKHAALARAALARFSESPTPANLEFLFHTSYDIAPADLRKAILTLAVQGKLVPQNPSDEPARDWLRRAAGANPGDESGTRNPPSPVPEAWIWLRMETICAVAGGIQKTPNRTPRNNAFPYLGVSNVHRGRLDLTNVKEFELEPGELESRRLEAGDLLVIEGNGSLKEIGRCAKWNGEIMNCVHQNHVIRCRPCDARISDFVLLFLNSPDGMELMQRLAITSSGLYSLSVGKIREVEVPLPPLAEQRRIVAKVDQLMALVDQLEAQIAAARAAGETLMEAIIVGGSALKPSTQAGGPVSARRIP